MALLPAAAIASIKPQATATTDEGKGSLSGTVAAKTVSVVFVRTGGAADTRATGPGAHAKAGQSTSPTPAATALLQFTMRWNARGYVHGMSVRPWPPRQRRSSRHETEGDVSSADDVLQDAPRVMRFVHRSYACRAQQAVS